MILWTISPIKLFVGIGLLILAFAGIVSVFLRATDPDYEEEDEHEQI